MTNSTTIYPGNLECPSCHKNKIGIVVADPSQTSKVLEQAEKNKIILANPSSENVSVQWLCKDCYATGQVTYKLESESFYEIHHDFYGCLNPRCSFVYTEDETKTADFADYMKNHLYGHSAPNLFKLEAKVWTLDDVIEHPPISGWTPRYALMENGFELVHEIDLYELFDGIKFETDSKGFRSKPWHPPREHNLEEKKDEFEKILENLDYKNRILLIYRDYRRGSFAVWDNIDIFGVGEYHSKKVGLRKKISEHWEEEQKKEEIEREKRIAYNKANGIEIPDWETAKKRLDKFTQGKHPKNFLFDPVSDTGYDMDSVEDRKHLFNDVHKRKRKDC